ncbi:MAG: serine--tRNA ligase [Ignavibacteria bacterium]|nr:serine--tRNA ligase [Ignavibacteria bacterium]MBP6509140.1 serine--tRNA ligase [Candidatus Kapabacteria bacterium]MBK6419858.1 serine--tRNA ligase [Ignavibacteria bacterium]MBK6759510.1 serine--tRNA ligase [Ignavibacteria bacterium]MBK7184400.1 serine--tRNA ligase [Ignavibacteria bacterium]
MIDIKLVRENPELVKQNCINKNDNSDIDALVALDVRRRAIIQEVEELKSKRNAVTLEISALKKSGADASDMITSMREVGDKIKELDEILREVEENISSIMLMIPNIAHPTVPIGKDANDNVEVRRSGECLERSWHVDHIEISRRLGILDFERGAKVTGAGFGFYVGKGARLERALINFFVDTNTELHGYKEIMTPFVVNSDSCRGTGQLPKSQDDMFYVEKDDLYLIPTAEVPITNFHRDEIISGTDLPVKYAGYSACFRREAGSHGKDTRGFLRVHQFNKVELVKFVRPETSYDELESLVGNVEYILQQLGLTYRVLLLCSGDMTFGGSKTYDLEVWSPYEQKWLEVSSCTNFESFQARRANIRYKESASSKPEYLHTLNGSGLATSRVLVALLEQYQTEDGHIQIPPCLQKYCGFDVI